MKRCFHCTCHSVVLMRPGIDSPISSPCWGEWMGFRSIATASKSLKPTQLDGSGVPFCLLDPGFLETFLEKDFLRQSPISPCVAAHTGKKDAVWHLGARHIY